MSTLRARVFALPLVLAAACGAPASTTTTDGGTTGTDGGKGVESVTISGTVVDDSSDQKTPIAGATVNVVGASPVVSATSGADGAFSLKVPAGARTLFLQAIKDGWGDVAPVKATATGATGVELRPVSATNVEQVLGALKLTVDATKGAVDLRFATSSLAGGESATLGGAFDAEFFVRDGVPVQTTAVPPRGQNDNDAELAFALVAAGTTTIAVAGAPQATTCALDFSDVTAWPVVAKSITRVPVTCAAVSGGKGRAALTGHVHAHDAPVPGALVTLVGTNPLITTRSGPDGAFVVSAPIGLVQVRAEHEGQWASFDAFNVPANGLDIQVGGPLDTEVAQVSGALGLAVDATKGIVAVNFENASDFGGESATLSATADKTFTLPKHNGAPIVATSLQPGADNTLIFAFVAAGTTTVTLAGSPFRTSCTPAVDGMTTWPVAARTVTQVHAKCQPDTSAALATVSGTVQTDSGPLAGGVVELIGHPTFRAVADDAGHFSMDLPVGTRLVRASAPGHWSEISALVVPEAGLTQADLRPIDDAKISDVAGKLGVTVDETKAIVSVNFDGQHRGGRAATISAASTKTFTFNAAGDPVVSTTTLTDGENFVGFIWIAPGTTTATVQGTAAETCTLSDTGLTSWPVEARTITKIRATCVTQT